MTDLGSKPAFTPATGSASLLDPAPPPAAKRRRAKLWELNGNLHCSVIGTCLTAGELRRVMGKVIQTAAGRSDHDLHSQAVGLCAQQSPAAKLLQKALDHRHEAVVKRFSRIAGETAVMQAWDEAHRSGDIPGAYWATLTHPDLEYGGMRQAFGDVHMLSHLVGAANRADIRRLTALEEENAALRAKVERQQLRLQEAVTSRDATIRRLGALAARQPAPSTSDAGEEFDALRRLAADLQARLDVEAARRERLERRAAEAAEAAARSERRGRETDSQLAAALREIAVLEAGPDPEAPAGPLPPERVLYVGGRPSCVHQMRAALEAAGGELLHHDGGKHDHASLLPGLVGQADRVAFPVDCVSHDAALAVKRLCRQAGKPWTPLRSSGLASFLAMLAGSPPERPGPDRQP